MNRHDRFRLLLFAMILVALSGVSRPVRACEMCRMTGSAVFHRAGGDDFDDAVATPPNSPGANNGMAQTSFAVTGGRWPVDQPGSPLVTLTYSYENFLDGSLKGPTGIPLPVGLLRKSVETALGLWASVVPVRFIEVPDDGLPYGPSTKHGDIRIRHVYINGPDIPGQPPQAKAQAYFPFGGDLAGDVEFDRGDPWQEFGTLPVPDILGAMTHEVGHSLGLHHSDIPQANMYWIFRRTQGLGDGWLHPDDIAGMRSIYGPGTGSVMPLFIPEPATALVALVATLAFVTASRARLSRTPAHFSRLSTAAC